MSESNGYSESSGSQKKGLSVAALVFGLLSVFLLCCGVGIVLAPIAILLGIIALATKKAGKGMAITGIICGIIPIIIVAAFAMAIKPIWPYREDILKDYSRITVEQDTIFADYEATGQIPDFLKKYEEEPFKSFFEKYDITIYKIMDSLMENHKQGTLTQVSYGGTAAAVIPANVVLIPFTA